MTGGDDTGRGESQHAWYDRLAELRRRAMARIGPNSTAVVAPALLIAAVLCGKAFGFISFWMHFGPGSLLFLGISVFILWAALRLSWWYTQRRTTRQVRLVNSMIHQSNLLLQIIEPLHHIEPESPDSRRIWDNPRLVKRFDDLIQTSAADIEKLWYQSGNDQATLDRLKLMITPSDLPGSRAISGIALLLLLMFSLDPFIIILSLAMVTVVLVALVWTGKLITRLASLVAICDFMMESYEADEYYGWAMPVRIADCQGLEPAGHP